MSNGEPTVEQWAAETARIFRVHVATLVNTYALLSDRRRAIAGNRIVPPRTRAAMLAGFDRMHLAALELCAAELETGIAEMLEAWPAEFHAEAETWGAKTRSEVPVLMGQIREQFTRGARSPNARSDA